MRGRNMGPEIFLPSIFLPPFCLLKLKHLGTAPEVGSRMVAVEWIEFYCPHSTA